MKDSILFFTGSESMIQGARKRSATKRRTRMPAPPTTQKRILFFLFIDASTPFRPVLLPFTGDSSHADHFRYLRKKVKTFFHIYRNKSRRHTPDVTFRQTFRKTFSLHLGRIIIIVPSSSENTEGSTFRSHQTTSLACDDSRRSSCSVMFLTGELYSACWNEAGFL
jgi:hypothetical protein